MPHRVVCQNPDCEEEVEINDEDVKYLAAFDAYSWVCGKCGVQNYVY